ncbi:MAG: GbsR/MarR family transcriptional regulator [Planctomycetota bacterium]|jgi:DNA-binding transcriptional regulator GbsR (MarR family)
MSARRRPRPADAVPPPDEALPAAQDRFIGLWGRMASSWGIARTMAEVHGLLYIVGEPMNTDDVMARLDISRGNASMTLRTLVDWGIVSRVHRRGDRKEYFVAEQDVWKLFATILRERKKREIDPLVEALVACREETELPRRRRIGPRESELEAHNARLDDMLEFIRMVDGIARRLVGPSGKGLERAARLLARAS